MNKKGNLYSLFSGVQKRWRAFKGTYLYKMVSKSLSFICSIILAILLVIGALMFYFNMKIKAYERKGVEYTAPFGMYTIISGSMEPNVSVYDVVIAVEQDINKIKIGDVITFVSSWDLNYGYTVTHRVVGITKTMTGEVQLTTKGDNNPTADGATVTSTNLVGKVVGRLPGLGKLQFFLATKMGWFIVVFIPAAIIIILDIMKIFKLYILKGEIDNVKPYDEAKRAKRRESLKRVSSKAVKQDEKVIQRPIKTDENIDTVELPKVDKDGVMKENTSELPSVVDNEYHSGRTEIISIINADIEAYDQSKVKEEQVDNGLPALRASVEEPKTENDVLPKRKELKRREK